MKMFFKTRSKARQFTANTAHKVSDQGSQAASGKRWAVTVSGKRG